MTSLKSLSGYDDDYEDDEPLYPDGFQGDYFEKLLVKTLKEYSHTRKYNIQCNSAIIDNVSEFLPCFIILGYDYNGEPVEIVKSKTIQEKESLGMRLQKFVPSFFNQYFTRGDEA